MTKKFVIWCCSAAMWARCIAWFQIVANCLVLILCSFSSLFPIDDLQNLINFDLQELALLLSKQSIQHFTTLCIGLSTMSILFASFLLIGAHKRIRGFVTSWLIFTVLSMVIDFVMGILHSNSRKIIPTFLRIFFVAIVCVFHDELKQISNHNPLTDDGTDDDL